MPNYLSRMKPNGANGTEYKLKDEELREVVSGISDQITETDTKNSTPFLYRETPYEADRVFLDELVGGSVAWNQLVQNGNFANGTTSWELSDATASVSGGVCSVTPTASGINLKQVCVRNKTTHKILVSVFVKSTSNDIRVTIQNNEFQFSRFISGSGNWEHIIGIYTSVESNEVLCFHSDGTAFQVKDCNIVDLTQYFGSSTIPDYAYTLEQTTAGSGIAWLKSHGFFTKDYYPYNTGELISVKTSGKKVVGFNQWDEEWEYVNGRIYSKNYINVIPSITYFFGNTWLYDITMYDSSFNSLGSPSLTTVTGKGFLFTTDSNCVYIKFRVGSSYGTTYNHDICINISKTEGTPKNGDYVPYEEHTYDISNIDLRGIPKLVNNELVYDGDIYESDGDVTRKYGVVDLGSLIWVYQTYPNGSRFASSSLRNLIKKPTSASEYASGMISSRFNANGDPINNVGTTLDKLIAKYVDGDIYIIDKSYSDAATFKTAMSGVMLIYELTTPTTETTDQYTNPQICDKDGTEEFIDNRTVPIPVGHNSRYANLPSMMDGDFLNYMVDNFASKEYTDRRMDALGDLAHINKDGSTSTKFLRGDGTWQNTGIVKEILLDTTVSVGDDVTFVPPTSYNFLVFEMYFDADGTCGSAIVTDLNYFETVTIIANDTMTEHICSLHYSSNQLSVMGSFGGDSANLRVTAF